MFASSESSKTFFSLKSLSSVQLTFLCVLGFFLGLCPAVCVNLDLAFCLHRYCQTRCHHLPGFRFLVFQWFPGILREIPGGTRGPFPTPTACREVDPSSGETVGLDLQGSHGNDHKRVNS